jgi:hypothetical protein
MHLFRTVAQVLLIASIANSALAAPKPAPEGILEERGAKWTAADYRNMAKTAAITGLIAGAVTGAGQGLDRLILSHPFKSSSGQYVPSPPQRLTKPNHKHLTYNHFFRRRAFHPESLYMRSVPLTRDALTLDALAAIGSQFLSAHGSSNSSVTSSQQRASQLADLSDDHLRLLSALSRRAIENLD